MSEDGYLQTKINEQRDTIEQLKKRIVELELDAKSLRRLQDSAIDQVKKEISKYEETIKSLPLISSLKAQINNAIREAITVQKEKATNDIKIQALEQKQYKGTSLQQASLLFSL